MGSNTWCAGGKSGHPKGFQCAGKNELTETSWNFTIIGVEQALARERAQLPWKELWGKGFGSPGGHELILSQQCALAAVRGNCSLSSFTESIDRKVREGIIPRGIIPICLASETRFGVLHWNWGSLAQERHSQTGELLVELQRGLENGIIGS